MRVEWLKEAEKYPGVGQLFLEAFRRGCELERERCARIAEAHPGACQIGCETGEEIAKRIREGQ